MEEITKELEAMWDDGFRMGKEAGAKMERFRASIAHLAPRVRPPVYPDPHNEDYEWEVGPDGGENNVRLLYKGHPQYASDPSPTPQRIALWAKMLGMLP